MKKFSSVIHHWRNDLEFWSKIEDFYQDMDYKETDENFQWNYRLTPTHLEGKAFKELPTSLAIQMIQLTKVEIGKHPLSSEEFITTTNWIIELINNIKSTSGNNSLRNEYLEIGISKILHLGIHKRAESIKDNYLDSFIKSKPLDITVIS